MKRLLGAVIAISISASLVAAPAFSAVKSGATCAKIGTKQTLGNKTFTCIKSGKRLVWNTGTITKPTAPSPASSPAPATAVSEPPVVSPTTSPSPTKILKVWEQLRLRVNNQYAERFKSEKDIDIQFVMSPTVDPEKATETAKAYREAGRYWTKFYGSKGEYPIVWVLLSEKDYDWWHAKVTELEGPAGNFLWDPTTNMLGHCGLSSTVFCGYGTTQVGTSGKQTLFQYNVIGSRFSGKPVANVVNHESVHLYQLSSNQTFPRDIPCWYVEGQATFYGNSLSMTNDHDWEYQRVISSIPDAKKKSADEWVQQLEYLQNNPDECRKDSRNYSIGSIMWEYLLLNYSEEVMHKILIYTKDHTWADATQQILGVSSTGLNRKLAEYISSLGTS